MTIDTLITKAQIFGAVVHVTRHLDQELATVQVLGLTHMTEFPLPVRQAADELRSALRVKGAV